LAIGLERRRVLEDRHAEHLLLAPGAAYLERDLYNQIERLRTAARPWNLAKDEQIGKAVAAAERQTKLSLTDEQRMAVRVLLQQGVACLQGGAGTGKTTSMRVLVTAWNLLGGRVEAAALSGKAALRLAQCTGMDVLTIAQVLKRSDERARLEASGAVLPEQEGETGSDGKVNKRLPRFTPETLVLLDESSMVDLANLRKLILKLPPGARLLLIGDAAQLPPIGLGQVFHDMVHAADGVVELTRTLRQAVGNPLLDAASDIRAGRVPSLPRFEATFARAAPGRVL
jgi:exodeoxyribonuclease V alpha subunit